MRNAQWSIIVAVTLSGFGSVQAQEKTPPKPDPLKTKTFMEQRKKRDPGAYKAMMRFVNSLAINRLVKRRLYGELKKRMLAVKKKGWIPVFDFEAPVQHAIGSVKSTDDGWVSVVPTKIISDSEMSATVHVRTVMKKGRRYYLVKKEAGEFVFHLNTKKFLVGKVAEFTGEFITAGDPKDLWPLDRKTIED